MNKMKVLLFSGLLILMISFTGCSDDDNENSKSVTLHTSTGGTVEGEGMYDEGSSVTVFATPNEDYQFSNWRNYDSGEIVSDNADYKFNIIEDRSLIAYFEEFLEKTFLVTESENMNMPIIPDYATTVPLNTLKLMTRYIGNLFIDNGIDIDNSGVVNVNGTTQMVINTQDLDNRGLYTPIVGGGPHIWIAKRHSVDDRVNPWAENDKLTFQMNASVPFVELTDPNGNTASSGFSADLAPVTQLSFGLYLFDQSTQKTFAYIIPVYESRGTYQESANNTDTFVSFVSSPLEDSSTYITKAPESERLQMEPFSDKRFFKVSLTRENLLKGIRDTNTGMSENLANYQVTFMGVLFELPNYVENGHNITMAEVSDFLIYMQ